MERIRQSGTFRPSDLCDACGKPVGGDCYEDLQATGGDDGPGRCLCGRALCVMRRQAMPRDQRREYYAAQRDRNRR